MANSGESSVISLVAGRSMATTTLLPLQQSGLPPELSRASVRFSQPCCDQDAVDMIERLSPCPFKIDHIACFPAMKYVR